VLAELKWRVTSTDTDINVTDGVDALVITANGNFFV
jgi:hypothetical protein